MASQLFLPVVVATIGIAVASLSGVDILPAPLYHPTPSPNDAPRTSFSSLTFPGLNASNFVESLVAIGPRPFNSLNNIKARDLILDYVKKAAEDAKNRGNADYPRAEIEVDRSAVVTRNLSWFKVGKLPEGGPATYKLTLDNILFKLVGQCEEDEIQKAKEAGTSVSLTACPALLVSTHYDTALNGPGGTDAAMPIGVIVETFKVLAQAPRLAHSVIFLVNNGEEINLLGALHFIGHRWFREVRSFINLEGAGKAGPALLFRSSNKELLKSYSKTAPYPHAAIVGNDIFKAQLIRSNTDYAVYNEFIPGLDVAFYQRRYRYHTKYDTYDRSMAGSLQQMGSNCLQSVIGIANSPTLLPSWPKPSYSPAIFWEENGIGMFVISFGAYTFMSAVAFVACVVLLIRGRWLWTKLQKGTASGGIVPRIGRIVVTGLLGAVAPVLATLTIDHIKPFTLYAHPIMWRIIVVSAIGLGSSVPFLLAKLHLPVARDFTPDEVEPILSTQRDVVNSNSNSNAATVIAQAVALLDTQLDQLSAGVVLLPLAVYAQWNGFGFFHEYTPCFGILALSICLDWFLLGPAKRATVLYGGGEVSRAAGRFQSEVLPWMNRFLGYVIPLCSTLPLLYGIILAMEPTSIDGTPGFLVPLLCALYAAPQALLFWGVLSDPVDITSLVFPNLDDERTSRANIQQSIRAKAVKRITSVVVLFGIVLVGCGVSVVSFMVPPRRPPFTESRPFKYFVTQEVVYADERPLQQRMETLFHGTALTEYYSRGSSVQDPMYSSVSSFFPSARDHPDCIDVPRTPLRVCSVTKAALKHGVRVPQFPGPSVTVSSAPGQWNVTVSHPRSRICFLEQPGLIRGTDGLPVLDVSAGNRTAWQSAAATTVEVMPLAAERFAAVQPPAKVFGPNMALARSPSDAAVEFLADLGGTAEFRVRTVGLATQHGGAPPKKIPVLVGCLVDSVGLLPGLEDIEARLPNWAVMLGAGMGAMRAVVEIEL
ncbi:hypothetical protein DFJ73DRAFT_856664 [Zopfochytrium polystomum]|nr:hypothetical protein DFJ73DRAFT_856664 [Zopfochytrium polystomum]